MACQNWTGAAILTVVRELQSQIVREQQRLKAPKGEKFSGGISR
jgi:hypothetical protein